MLYFYSYYDASLARFASLQLATENASVLLTASSSARPAKHDVIVYRSVSRLFRHLYAAVDAAQGKFLHAIHAQLQESKATMPAALPGVLARSTIVLFGDSLTQRGFEPEGWAAALTHYYGRRADVYLSLIHI